MGLFVSVEVLFGIKHWKLTELWATNKEKKNWKIKLQQWTGVGSSYRPPRLRAASATFKNIGSFVIDTPLQSNQIHHCPWHGLPALISTNRTLQKQHYKFFPPYSSRATSSHRRMRGCPHVKISLASARCLHCVNASKVLNAAHAPHNSFQRWMTSQHMKVAMVWFKKLKGKKKS